MDGLRIELYRDKDSQWRWRLVAANNRQLAGPQEGFHNRDDALANAVTVTDFERRVIPVIEESTA